MNDNQMIIAQIVKCEVCGDTGLLVPVKELSLERLISCKNDTHAMACDYCDTFGKQTISLSFKLNGKYIDRMIEKRIHEKTLATNYPLVENDLSRLL